MASGDRLVWIDLEMTGLDPERCAIVEIASIITDAELRIVAEGPSLVIHQPEEALATMNAEVAEMHARSGLAAAVRAATLSLGQAEELTLAFVRAHCTAGTALVCGNSVWKDRQFLARYMPQLAAYLNYRTIDVSTIKELARRWYAGRYEPPKKADSHRALDDIRESIAELAWYRARVFVPS
jgi:oligoribonuclease